MKVHCFRGPELPEFGAALCMLGCLTPGGVGQLNCNGLASSWPSGSVTTAQGLAATIKHILLCIALSVGPC